MLDLVQGPDYTRDVTVSVPLAALNGICVMTVGSEDSMECNFHPFLLRFILLLLLLLLQS